MASISIDRAWSETSAFIKREGALLFPVAMLFVAIPIALIFQILPAELRQQILMPVPNAPMPKIPAYIPLCTMLAAAIILVGDLALYALALRPGISVKEALQRAVRRIPIMVVAGGIVFVFPAMILRTVPSMPLQTVCLIASLFLWVRMTMLYAVIIDQNLGITDSIRRSWTLGKHGLLRLFGFWLAIFSLTILAGVVAQMLFGLVGYLVGGASAGYAAADLGTAAVMGAAQVYQTVMIARIYRQVSE